MTHAPFLTGSSCVLLLSTFALGQGFSYPNFGSTSGLALNGSAVQLGTSLRVTNSAAGQVGSVWHAAPVKVTEGFETEFQFAMSSAPEGMAFVIQGSPAGAAALGGDLWGIGYGFGSNGAPISNSIAFEIDGIQNGFLSDTSDNELSIHTVGALGNSENEGVSIARITPSIDLSNTQVHRLRIRYVPGVLEIYLNNQPAPLLTADFTFENGGTQLSGGGTGGLGLTGTDAWVGFTASTSAGSSGQYAELRSWSWTSYSLPDACYTGNVRLGSGGPFDLLTINGSNGGFFRTANLAIADPFTVALAPPPGAASAPFVLLGTLGIADPTTVTPTPWGQACFPLFAVLDIGSGLAPHSVTVPPGIAIAVPLTFQAVMATDPVDPTVIELTNAIALQFSLAPAPSIATVVPNSAPTGGLITVTGSNFSPFATVAIQGVPVVPQAITANTLTFAMPAGVPCGAQLRVRNPDGAVASAPFNPVPVITNQVNTSGPATGGASFIVIGTGFAPGSTITFNGAPAAVSTASATVLVATTPAGTPGPATVVVTTPGGCSVTANYTYL